jgi:hypothetical protein
VNTVLLAPVTISGKITNGYAGVPNVAVIASPTAVVDMAAYALTDAQGNYTISGLNPSDYKLAVIDTVWAANHATGYLPEWWGSVSSTDPSMATVVSATSSVSIAGNAIAGHDCDPSIYNSIAVLSGQNLSGKYLPGCAFSYAKLVGTDLSSAVLIGASIPWIDGTSAVLTNADLTGAGLSYAKLINANLTNAKLSWARLDHATLSGATLTGANLSFANFTGANLTGAVLTGANLYLVKWSNTTCPDGTNSDTHANTCVGHLS